MKGVKDNNGKFIQNALYVDKTCIVCKTLFKIKESALKYGRGKYCSRKCCDEHKKIICVGSGNGAFGRKESDEHKKNRMDKIWNVPFIRENIKTSLYDFQWKNGYWPGTSNVSNEKRKQTLMKKYGATHCWKVKEIRKKCDDTCIRLYGKSSYQLMMEALKICQTKIEITTQYILDKNNIQYKMQYEIWSGGNLKIYDFFIPSANLLIEIDGDFWHGNPSQYPKNKLLEIQQANILNDIFKNELATRLKYNLVRFWEEEVEKENYSDILLDTIKKYENVTITEKNKS
jgi:very-short-patch-repair endonuclease